MLCAKAIVRDECCRVEMKMIMAPGHLVGLLRPIADLPSADVGFLTV